MERFSRPGLYFPNIILLISIINLFRQLILFPALKPKRIFPGFPSFAVSTKTLLPSPLRRKPLNSPFSTTFANLAYVIRVVHPATTALWIELKQQ